MISYIYLYPLLSMVSCWYIPRSMTQDTKDFLIRGMPLDLAEKLKTAAALHRMSMKDYLIQLFEEHLAGLESKGVSLSLEKRKKK